MVGFQLTTLDIRVPLGLKLMSLRDLLSGLIAPLPKSAPNIGFALDLSDAETPLVLVTKTISHTSICVQDMRSVDTDRLEASMGPAAVMSLLLRGRDRI